MMSFTESLRSCLLTKIFNWQDRAPRSEYWWFCLFLFVAPYILAILVLIPILGAIIYTIGMLYLFWAHLMVSIRRLHDKDKSGLLLLVPFALMVASLIIVSMGEFDSRYADETLLLIAGACMFLALGFYIYLFVLFVTEGTVGYNRFGPDPLAWYRQNLGQNSFTNQGFDPRYNPNYQPNKQQNYNYDPNMPPQGYSPNYDPNIPPQVYKTNTPPNSQPQRNNDNRDNGDAKLK